MNQKEIEQLLSGKKKVDAISETDAQLVIDFLKKKFKKQYKEIVFGYELDIHRKHSPMSFSFGTGTSYHDQIRFSMFSDWDYTYGHHSGDRSVTKITINFQDGGVHMGSSYGHETPEVRRSTSLKHIVKLVPKIEEVYGFLKIVADKYREEHIKGRIHKLQYDVSSDKEDLEIQIMKIKEFKKEHGKGNYVLTEQLDELLDEKFDLVEKEKTRLSKLPEFKNPRKVLHID